MSRILPEWQSFYVITGSAGAGLTGLMFVVMALASERLGTSPPHSLDAFSTPTVAHFSIVLLIASVASMPLHGVSSLRISVGACACVGVTFIGRAAMGMYRLRSYSAVAEDWIFNVIIPFIVYGALFASALLMGQFLERSMFALATIVLTLLFLGIRNAWDVTVFLLTKTTPPSTDTTHDTR